MKKKLLVLKNLALTKTAKDTYILFSGNILSAFLGFVFTLIVARALSVSDFGIFSAANNLVIIIASVTDVGISSAVINFASKYYHEGKTKKANEYVKAAYLTRFFTVLGISLLVLLFAPYVAKVFLATNDSQVAVWVAILSIGIFSWTFFPYVLQTRRKFFKSAIADVSIGIVRVVIVFAMFLAGLLTVTSTLAAFTISALIATVTAFYLVGVNFLKSKPRKQIYKNLFLFSGWLGVNKVVSSISGRLDVQMLASLAGATATGLYSIPSRLALFVVVLSGSLTSVYSTRFASFSSKDKEKAYLIKTTLSLIPIVLGILLWIMLARPFMLILFGQKYASSVGVFRALTFSMIPFIITVPSATAIIYALKKPIFIGTFAIFQLVATFALNLLFIPKFQSYGPTITFFIVHSIFAIYTWSIVIKHYWFEE